MQVTAIQDEMQTPQGRSLPWMRKLRDTTLEAYQVAEVDLQLEMEGIPDGLDVERAVDAGRHVVGCKHGRDLLD